MAGNKFRKQIVALIAVGLMGAGSAGSALADDVTINMTTTWPEGINLIETDKHFVDVVNKLGDGSIKIKFHAGETLIPSTQVFDAVRSGSIDASADWPGYWGGVDTAFGLLGAFPMLFTAGDYILWIEQWGGKDVFNDVYGEHGMVYLPYGVVTSESGPRGKKAIASLADLKGKRIRMSGRPQGEILKKNGASQITVPGAEVYQAVERGVVDAAEFSTPSTDLGMGLQEVSSNVMSPGWHQPGSTTGVMINKKVWDKLSDQQKYVMNVAAQSTMLWSLAYFEKQSAEAVREFEKAGTKVNQLSDEDMAELQKQSNEVLVEEACRKGGENFAKIALSQLDYMEDYDEWRGMQGEFSLGRNLAERPDIDKIRECAG